VALIRWPLYPLHLSFTLTETTSYVTVYSGVFSDSVVRIVVIISLEQVNLTLKEPFSILVCEASRFGHTFFVIIIPENLSLYSRVSNLGYMYPQGYICLSEGVHLRLSEDVKYISTYYLFPTIYTCITEYYF